MSKASQQAAAAPQGLATTLTPPDGGAAQQDPGAVTDPSRADPKPPPAASTSVRAVMLRRASIEGVWYPHGAVLTLAPQLARASEGDGAVDTAEGAIAYALANGAPEFVHVTPPADQVDATS